VLILGIDPGTAITGYGLVREEDGLLTMVLADVLADHRPAAAAVEELFFSRNVRTALSVGHARGVTLLALADAGLPIYEYKPLEVKQAIAGYGGADKRQVQEMVRMLLNLDDVPRPDDAADAVAVAVCHIHSARMAALIADAE
jgi:crossover junction endodeoxyribonuclease RuvC